MEIITIKSATNNEIINYKNTLYGRNFRSITRDEIILTYNEMFKNNRPYWDGDLKRFTRIQIRNKLSDRLKMELEERKLSEITGINQEWITDKVLNAIKIAKEIYNEIDIVADEDVEYELQFEISFGLSELKRLYRDYYSKNIEDFNYYCDKWFNSIDIRVAKYLAWSNRGKNMRESLSSIKLTKRQTID